MTVINHKSISGVTSITAPAGSDNLFTVHTNDTTERFRIDASGHQNISGIITAANFKTGTTNVHNVGVEAAGINVLGADTPIGTGATIYNSGAAVFTGVVTATSFKGSITDATGYTTINNNANYRLISGDANANELNAEPNLTYNGSILGVTGDIAVSTANRLYFGNSDVAWIKGEHGGSGYLQFGVNTEHMRLNRAGQLGIGTDAPAGGSSLHIQGGGTSDKPHIRLTADRGLIARLGDTSGGAQAMFDLYGTDGSTQIVRFISGGGDNWINTGGNLGIGTDNPDKLLEIHTTNTNTYSSAISNTPNPNTFLTLTNKAGTDGSGSGYYAAMRFSIANGATSSGWLSYHRTGDNKGAFTFKSRVSGSNYPELMRISAEDNGRIGIRNNLTTNFWDNANTLTIGDGGGSVGMTFFTAAAADGSHIAFQESTGNSPEGLISYYQGGYSTTADRDNMIFKTNGGERFRIGSTAATFSAENININRNAGDPFLAFQTSGTSNAVIYGGASSGLRAFTKPSGGSLTSRVKIYPSGKVTINPYNTFHDPTHQPTLTLSNESESNLSEGGRWSHAAIGINNTTHTASGGSKSQIVFGYLPRSGGYDFTYGSAYMGATSVSQSGAGKVDLVFGTKNVTSDTQPSERLRITSDGKIVMMSQGASLSDGYAALEIRQNTGGKHLVLATNSATSSTNDVMLGFKLHPSGQDERVKAGIICRGTGTSDYGQPSRMSFCLDPSSDNDNISISADEKVCILSNGRMGLGTGAPEAVLHPRANPEHGTDIAFQVGTGNRFFRLSELSGQDNFSNCYMQFYDNSLREILTLENSYAGLVNMGMEIRFRGHGGGQTGSIRAYNTAVNSTSGSVLHLNPENNNSGFKISSSETRVVGGVFHVSNFQIRDGGWSGTWDTGISVNQGNAGGAMIVIACKNWNAGDATHAGMYFVRFPYDGNNNPSVWHIGGNNSWTIDRNTSNHTLQINGGSGNQRAAFIWTT